jgi:electron transfer flavoprotein beta subunit
VKALVVYKWARDEADALVCADESIDWRNAKMTAGEDDPAVLAVARQVAADAEIVGLTIGDGDASWAPARGVGSAVSVGDAPPLADNSATAAILAAAVRTIGDVDVVVIGDSQQDAGVGAALGGHLGWPTLLGLVAASAEGGEVHAVRKMGGDLRTIAVPTPCVLGIAAEADVDKVPGMKELLAARKRPVTKLTLTDLGVRPADLVALGSVKPHVKATRVFEGDPADAAARLVAALRTEGVL